MKFNSIFEEILGALDEIGTCLKCYAKISIAYESSDEVRECLVSSYTKIVTFWAKATKVLAKNGKPMSRVLLFMLKSTKTQRSFCHYDQICLCPYF